MAAINDLIEQIENPELRFRVQQEVNKLNKQRKFGLVFEEHVPENTFLYDVPVKRGSLVAKRDNGTKETYRVIRIDGEDALCEHTVSHVQETIAVDALVSVAQLGEPIYPYLKPMGEVINAPNSDLWHTLIEADNYHALQLLIYLYCGKVDCIYIDPPYNTGARDWKYNNDYVDGSDSYRHSKWLSFMKKRLQLAKKLLNPNNSILIITIDEKEFLHLGCLLEEVFSDASGMQMVSITNNNAGTGRSYEFARVNEYAFFVRVGAAEILPEFTYGDEHKSVLWDVLRRSELANIRPNKKTQFFPIFINDSTGRVHSVGEPITPDIDISTIVAPDGCTAVFPIRDDGIETSWSCKKEEMEYRIEKGYIKVGRRTPNKPQKYSLMYIKTGAISDIESGKAEIQGYNKDGSVKAFYTERRRKNPSTVLTDSKYDARPNGSNLLNAIIGKRFDYPKSLYAVEDCLKFVVANNPNAIILDFFAGSGTTLHAVNLLNKEDGGKRRCIMVTNNEIGEPKERELKPQGFRPGDEEWERWGIARYVNWPRTECSIKGIDVNGNPIEGEYITTKTETKLSDRRFNQINFLTDSPSLKQKKALVTLINKQKTVKLPTMSDDADFLISEENDSCNASILFNVTAIDDWKDALEGHDEITDFYIVTQKDSLFRQIKAEVSELMGQIEESVPVTMPMKDGFKANAAYFKLGFLDKTSVALGRQFKELLPILWMKAGAKGECPEIDSEELPKMLICEKNHFAVLIDESVYPSFEKKLNETNGIEVVYIVTDSDSGYKEMAQGLHVGTTYQLYRDYLDNFRINNVR